MIATEIIIESAAIQALHKTLVGGDNEIEGRVENGSFCHGSGGCGLAIEHVRGDQHQDLHYFPLSEG